MYSGDDIRRKERRKRCEEEEKEVRNGATTFPRKYLIKAFDPETPSLVSSSFDASSGIVREFHDIRYHPLLRIQMAQMNGHATKFPLYHATLETVYKVAICPRGNLPYKQIYFRNDQKLL